MKRKIFSVFFALVLVLSFSLVAAVPAGAEGEVVTLEMPTNVYQPAPFDVSSTTTNGETAYSNVRFNITVDGPVDFTGSRADIFTITEADAWTGVTRAEAGASVSSTFALDGVNFVGYWGPVDGFLLPTDYNETSVFTVQMADTAPLGAYEVTVDLVQDPLGTPQILATATDGFSLSDNSLYVGTGQQFTTIQAAIDAASPGDTINVADGTYSENILVNKSLTIQAASSPIIDGSGTLWVPAVEISAADVTLQGFTIQNFKADADHDLAAVLVHGDSATIEGNTIANITTDEEKPYGIGIDVTANSVDVTGNTVHDVDSIGIRVRARFGEPDIQMTGVILQDNTVYNTGNSGVLVVGNVTDITIRSNEIYNSLGPTPYSLFIAHGPDADVAPDGVTIEDNYIHDSLYSNVVIAGVRNVTISGNIITGAPPWPPGSPGKNIYILDDYLFGTNTLSANIEITNNDIQNGGYGVRILYTGGGDASNMAATTTINYNDISGNAEYGVENTISTAVVDATYNWWGDATGPSHDTLNPGGQGNAVSDNVLFSPWLYETQENFVSDAPCYAGSVVLSNVATRVGEEGALSWKGGWNSFSTPATLDSSANYINELLDLLTEEGRLSIVRAQRFDPHEGWVFLATPNEVIEDYQIKPGEGFFIQVSTKGSLPILCSTNPTWPPQTNLVAGWNLVGLSNSEGMTVTDALYNVNYSVVISASPPNAVSWSVPPDTASTNMELGEAYWLAMGQPGILFGHTTTPVADDMTWELNHLAR